MSKKLKTLKEYLVKILIVGLIFTFVGGGAVIVWAITRPIPDFEGYFEEAAATQSTKIYDRSGEVLLYDINGIRRTNIKFEEISDYIKKATLAIEDADFYNHGGVKLSSFLRAVIVNLKTGNFSQGGSTITQQVIKNTILTKEKKVSRKIKEMVLAFKLEKTMSKDEILSLYLNGSPYGGTIYGVQEASQTFFKKDAKDVSLAEAAYLASLPQAPSFYSPYGNNFKKLEARKNLVLDRMEKLGMISKEEATKAKEEKVKFYPNEGTGIKAPHFVFFVKNYLEEKYGEENLKNRGLKVVTTLDWELQKKAEQITRKYGEENATKYNASNAGLVAMDPKTGQILAMVGSRDYFNQEIDGAVNITTSYRQPGSSFKPIVYATAFEKGYTDKTVVFDLPTEFNTSCNPDGNSSSPSCYTPVNYDAKYLGPVSLRDALAQSRNVPAVKVLYLAGLDDSLRMAKRLGITSLKDKNQYGLTLVLGGGEVSLLEMTSAYGVFANDGNRNPYNPILKITDEKGEVVEEYQKKEQRVISENIARLISDVLTDNVARTPAFGSNSYLYFPNRQVAVKTGTTNDYKDAWIVGYTPNLVVGAWAGNNDNKPMSKKVAGYIIAPLWNSFMNEALTNLPTENFNPPQIAYEGLKPILRGYWQGGDVRTYNSTGQLTNISEDRVISQVHSILYWVNKNDPNGPRPINPYSDPQFRMWEYPIRRWVEQQGITEGVEITISRQNNYSQTLIDQISFIEPQTANIYSKNNELRVKLNIPGVIPVSQIDYFVNNNYIGSSKSAPFEYAIIPNSILDLKPENELKVIIYDQNRTQITKTVTLKVQD